MKDCMDSEQKFWITIWAIIASAVVIMILATIIHYDRFEDKMVKNGFQREAVCRSWTYEWVKEEQ
jgi:hypothetical protein